VWDALINAPEGRDMANTDAHPALRRLMIEGNDGVLRALRVQEFDAK
jgi:hypothetical protein